METNKEQRTFKAKHMQPGDFHLGYILLPVGYSYNAEWLKAKKGDIIRFWDGGEFPIFSVRKLRIGDAGTDILCRMRYGITLKRALQKWQLNARLEGHGMKAISTEECLWVVYATV